MHLKIPFDIKNFHLNRILYKIDLLRVSQCQDGGMKPELGTIPVEKGETALFLTLKPHQERPWDWASLRLEQRLRLLGTPAGFTTG